MVDETHSKGEEGTEPEGTPADTGAGNQPEESKAVTRLRKDNERLETQLAKKQELLAQQKEIEAREALGGGSEAGAPSQKPQKETPREYSERIMRGE